MNPWSRFDGRQLAVATGCPEAAIVWQWPHVMYALDALGIADPFVQVAAAATIAIETASTFEPVREAFWLDEDWRRANLRYYPYYGRGLIQLTWEENYRAFGNLIGQDLVGNPDLALDTSVSAWVLAYFFRDHGVAAAAIAQDWQQTRIRVQGGLAGWDRYIGIVDALNNMPMPVPEVPSDPCAAEKARYDALRAAVAALTTARPYRAPSKRRLLEIIAS